MAESLTPQQKLAVTDRGGKLLVSAAAGSGKTKVLVDRLLGYISDPVEPANIDDFLIITYTKAAAAELRGKIASKLSEEVAQNPGNRHLQRQIQRLYLTKISTVHGFCADILRDYAYRLDIASDFRVADESESMQLRKYAMDQILEEAYTNIGQDADFQAFVDTQGLGRNDSLVPDIVERVYDSAMCHLDPVNWLNESVYDPAGPEESEPLNTVWGMELAQDLFLCLDKQISAFRRCIEKVEGIQGWEKPCMLLKSTLIQLQDLRNSRTWDEIVAGKNIDYGRLVFSKKVDAPHISEPVKAVREACKETLTKKLKCFSDDAASVMADLSASSMSARGLIGLVKAFSGKYSQLKKQRHILDFSDLEHKTLDLLVGKSRAHATAAAQEIAERFREIMVDEYQDSNAVQDCIFQALTSARNNLFMVGDVKQSIYQFRLADPEIFLEKYNSYIHAEKAQGGQGRKILLSHNFRSGPGVIEAVNHVFDMCMSQQVGGLEYGEEEALREGLPHCGIQDPEVEFYGISTQEHSNVEEAAFVAKRIAQMLDGKHYVRQGDGLRPIRPEDIVILLRSPGSVGMIYEDALANMGIPCAGAGGMDLFSTEEIGTLVSLLQIISNPRQDIPLLAVLASPVFSFTADDLAKLRCANKFGSVYDALDQSEDIRAKDFMTLLQDLRKISAMSDIPALLERIFNLTRLDTVYSVLDNGEIRRANLQNFYQLAVDYGSVGTSDLDRFLEYIGILSERGISAGVSPTSASAVTIMSIHKSKGLEFPVVFLCGLSRKFNREDLRQQVLCHKDLGIGLSCVDPVNRVRYPSISRYAISSRIQAESISEEMRVLYVAMTRARDRLIMTYAASNLEKELSQMAFRMDLSDALLMTSDVSSPGEWVLYSALRRTEAGAFFQAGEKPEHTSVSQIPWKIDVISAQPLGGAANSYTYIEDLRGQRDLSDLEAAVSFCYPFAQATKAPSKQTATQKKGRVKDKEAAEEAYVPKQIPHIWRKPAFIEEDSAGISRGNAMHGVLQYIRYDRCTENGISAELERLVSEGFVSSRQISLIDPQKLLKLFQSDFGRKLASAPNVLREFKFSVLDDAENYGDDLQGEKVLLQGVVDCALVENDGITVIDFKTDYTTQEQMPTVIERYREQVETYADALSRIFDKPVKGKALYLFALDCFCWI